MNPRDMDLYFAFPKYAHPYIVSCQEDSGTPITTYKYELIDSFLPRFATLMLRSIQETLVSLALTLDAVGWPLYDD